MKIEIKDAVKDDVQAILDIYNYAIVNTVATFHTEAQTLEERMEWFDAHGGIHPVLSLYADGKLAAWGSLSTWNPKPAYNGSVEFTLYVHKDYRGKGLGNMMMEALINKAKELKLHTLISLIVSSNEASIALHEKWDFTKVGVLKESGYKFDSYHDVDIYQLML